MSTPQHAIDAAKVLEGLEYCMDWKNQKPDAVRFATAMADARQFVIDARHPDPELARLREENERLRFPHPRLHETQKQLLDVIAERDQLRARITELEKRILDDNKAFGCELRDPNGTIWEHAEMLHKENAELRQSLEDHAQANDKLVVELANLRRDRELYHQLLFAVVRKFPGETRHQTALRYLREVEEYPGSEHDAPLIDQSRAKETHP